MVDPTVPHNGDAKVHFPADAEWAETKGADGLIAYQCEKNAESIDGLLTSLGVSLKA